MRCHPLLIALLLGAAPPWCAAQARSLTIGAQVGSVHMPMSDWEEFFGSVQGTDYSSDRLGPCADLLGRLSFGRHSIRAAVGFVRTSARGTFVSVFIPPPGASTFTTEWDFTGIPISVAYEFGVRGGAGATTTFLGAGTSLYHSRVNGRQRVLYPPDLAAFVGQPSIARDGWGYGFHGYLGQRAAITRRLSLTATVRASWSDGMGFTDDEGGIAVRFSGADVTVGIEYGL